MILFGLRIDYLHSALPNGGSEPNTLATVPTFTIDSFRGCSLHFLIKLSLRWKQLFSLVCGGGVVYFCYFFFLLGAHAGWLLLYTLNVQSPKQGPLRKTVQSSFTQGYRPQWPMEDSLAGLRASTHFHFSLF